MKSLDNIAQACGTDKASVFTRTYAKPKNYCVHYERFFASLRDKPIKLVEIGVGGGESARTWIDYFEKASIHGVDIVENTNPWNTPKSGVHPRYKFLQGNQSDTTMWACFLADCGTDFDVIIDDGSHEPKDIITAFSCLWPILNPLGYYAVEDLGCGFTNPGFPSHMDWIRSLIDAMNRGEGDIDSVYCSTELCILRKKQSP